MTHFWRCDILNRADVIDPFYSTWMQGMSYRRYSIIQRSHLFYTVTVPLSAHFYFRQDARGAGSQSSRNDTGSSTLNDEMATHVRKLNRYWSTMSATSCMSRWCRWFCQSLQYLGYLQCLSYLQRLRCLFKHPLSVSLYVQPNQVNISFSRELRTTSAVTIYIWSCETARNKSDSPKTHICDGCYNHRTGYNHQVSTSWFDNS